MKFIQVLSYKAADFLMKQKYENHQTRNVYYYGFQILIGGAVKMTLLFSLAMLTGTLKPMIVIMILFAALRMIAGGHHMDTYSKCIAISLALFILSAAIAQYTFNFWNTTVLAVFAYLSFFVTLYALIKWAPADNPNRPIVKKEEIRKFRILSLIYIIIWLVSVSFLIYYDLKVYVLAASFAVLLESLSISPAGFKFFNYIKDSLNNKKR